MFQNRFDGFGSSWGSCMGMPAVWCVSPLVSTFLALLTSLQRTLTIQDPPAGSSDHFEGMEKSRSSRMGMRATGYV
ncbi:hypothetical protein EDD15DRAFT_2230010, partial [Pisolithus albus]